MSVLIESTLGDFVIDLFIKERPRTCLNFVKLCKMKKYNFCIFHSIEEGFIAQTGDPTATGRGGQSIFADLYGEQASFFEMESNPPIRHRTRGCVSMVNNGEDMHGSQFFITLEDHLDYLDGKHTVFGIVSDGIDIIDKLNAAICDEDHRPYRDIRITHTIILDDPFEDPDKLKFPERSPSPSEEILKNGRIGVDELIDEDDGKDVAQLQEEIEAKEARARAHILEMVGDLHHADERPPDNVLFVCKLNAITTDEDLEIIFSRFGPVKCCEIIKDKKSGASLQYAFIEFENPEHCEAAYFKMDNVLIDDRRIHVDFSQSVSKNYQWKRQDKEEPTNNGKPAALPDRSSTNGTPYAKSGTSQRDSSEKRAKDLSRSSRQDYGRSRHHQEHKTSRHGKGEDYRSRHRDEHRHSNSSHGDKRLRHDRHERDRHDRHEHRRPVKSPRLSR